MLQQPTLSAKQGYGEQFDVESLAFFRRLLEAIRNREFVVYFQPKVSIKDMKITGAEALIRWKYQDQILPPVKFIPFCERTGLVIDVDFYVLEETCRQMRKWLDEGLNLVRVSVNFSKYHFNESGVAERIFNVIKSYNIPPEFIEVEFTETAYLDKEEILEYTVDKLRSYGIRSSIDDFGSGYSSLNMIQNMDFEVVKLDKSLLGKGVENSKAKKVISNIIRMAKELEMEVLAEGVETTEELNLLKSLDCDVVQGFFFDKPLPIQEFELRLRSGKYLSDGTLAKPERKVMELKDVEEIDINTAKNQNTANRYMYGEPVHEEKKHTGVLIVGVVLILMAITLVGVSLLWANRDKYKKGHNNEADVLEIESYSRHEVEKLVEQKEAELTPMIEERVRAEFLAMIREAAESSSGMTNLLRYLFPDDLVFMEGTKYSFVPINKRLAMHSVDSSKFVQDENTGFMHYMDDSGKKTSYMGIDVSSFQKDIDWTAVAKTGIDFAILRCGFRGYGSEGKLVEDTTFRTNIIGAKNAGIPTGFYFYTQAITTAEAVEEAKFVIDILKEFNAKGPVILDVESASSTERIKDLTPEQRTDNIIAFCDYIAQAGFEPMIYADVKFFTIRMQIERLEEYKKWYANYNGIEIDETTSKWSYNNPFIFPYEFIMWQYTNKGRLEGIKGDVDFNVSFEKWW